MNNQRSKLIPRKKIAGHCRRLKARKKRIVFTNGVFDIIHMGHVRYLFKAKTFGDVLIVGLNTDLSVRRIKGPKRPINKQADRAGILAALEMVDYIVLFSEDTPAKLIAQVKPDVLVKGADYRLSEIVGADFVKACGGRIERIRLHPGRSTSAILKKIR